MTNTTTEKISKIIEKIEENTDENNPKELKEKEIRKLLNEIDDELVEIEENAEKSQKEVVSKKVEELRSEVDGINKKWKWGRVKDFLSEDVKKGLNELKDEVVKLENPLAVVPSIFVERKSESMEEELNKWRGLFPKRSPEEVKEDLRNFASLIEKERQGYIGQLAEVQTKVGEEAKKTNSSSLSGLLEDINRTKEANIKLGIEFGKESGISPIFVPGGVFAAYLGTFYEGTVKGGLYFAEKAMDGGKELAQDAGEGATGLVKRFMDGADQNFGKVVEGTTEVTQSFLGIFNKGETIESLKKEIEILNKQLEEQKEEKDKLLKEKDERIAKKDKRIGDLEERIDSLQKSTNELFVAQIEEARSRATSPIPRDN